MNRTGFFGVIASSQDALTIIFDTVLRKIYLIFPSAFRAGHVCFQPVGMPAPPHCIVRHPVQNQIVEASLQAYLTTKRTAQGYTRFETRRTGIFLIAGIL
jgi:hypothetical protein